jgi:hypothetical protein
MSDFPTSGALRGHGCEFADAMQQVREQEKQELAEDRRIDLTRLAQTVERIDERNMMHRLSSELSAAP